MRPTKAVQRGIMGAAALVGVYVVARRDSLLGRAARRVGKATMVQLRYWRGAWPGIRYRLEGGHPDLDVSDDVLADRVRSSLGPLEHRLGLPRVHVVVREGVVVLHGEIARRREAVALERAVGRMPSVRGVESYLHARIAPTGPRPAGGSAPSRAHRVLVEAAHNAGVPEGQEARAARVVLAAFMERVPVEQRKEMLGHLPVDARSLAAPPRRRGASKRHGPDDLKDAVAHTGAVAPERAGEVTRGVLSALHGVLPDELDELVAMLFARRGSRAATSST